MKLKTEILIFLGFLLFIALFLCCNPSDSKTEPLLPASAENYTLNSLNVSGSQSVSITPTPSSAIDYRNFVHFGVGWTGFTLFLTDAPIDFVQAVYVAFNRVRVHLSVPEDPGQPSGWIDLPIRPTRTNMLDLQNNTMEMLADQDLPNGLYNEIRLHFDCSEGQAPSVLVEGIEIPLLIPSGCETGLKASYDFTLSGKEDASLLVDFDMRQSIHQTGNGAFVMSPVLRTFDQAEIGVISGQVVPSGIHAVVYAFDPGTFDPSARDPFKNAVNSTIPRQDGSFSLGALPEGVYDLVVTAEGYRIDTSQLSIDVAAEQETMVPTVSLIPEEQPEE